MVRSAPQTSVETPSKGAQRASHEHGLLDFNKVEQIYPHGLWNRFSFILLQCPHWAQSLWARPCPLEGQAALGCGCCLPHSGGCWPPGSWRCRHFLTVSDKEAGQLGSETRCQRNRAVEEGHTTQVCNEDIRRAADGKEGIRVKAHDTDPALTTAHF